MNDYILETGRKLGYPECCINYFINVWIPFTDLFYEENKHLSRKEYQEKHNKLFYDRCKLVYRTGFVPCDYHTEMFNEQGIEAIKKEVPKFYARNINQKRIIRNIGL